MSAKRLQVTLVKSTAGRLRAHKACAAGLGLRRTGASVLVADTPENRGMIAKIAYLLEVREDA